MTAAVLDRPAGPAPRPALPAIPRLVPAPECEPPLSAVRLRRYGIVGAVPAQRGAPPSTTPPPAREHRRWAPASSRPRAECRAPATARFVDVRAEAVPLWSVDPDCGVRRTPTAELPDPADWATVVCRGMLESLSGQRHVDQLRQYCAPDVFAGLQQRTVTSPESPALLISLDVCQPADGAVEAAAVFRSAGSTRALAMRIQGLDGRWRVTDLQLG